MRDDIVDLVHRYADAVVRRDADQWAACWAEDATWALGSGHLVRGREAIVDLWTSAMGTFEAVVQNVFNGEVHPAAGGAEGRWYIGEHFRRVGGEVGMLLAHYDDAYVRRDGRWVFASRALVPLYQGPPDLSGHFLNGPA